MNALRRALELAWAAGFFDGEGCTDVHRGYKRDHRYLRVQISQKDRRPLDRFAEAVEAGKVYGPYEGQTTPFLYSITGTKAYLVLEALMSYLSEPKREQAARVLAEIETFNAAKELVA